jgi:glycosyltransferase involved in cell wall biosynthesis
LRVGIDASNLRAGGGVTHLVELLRALSPEAHGISQVTVWGGGKTLAMLDDRPWLARVREPALDGALPARLFWQKARLPNRAKAHCDILFTPGGAYHGSFRPYVTMSQNLLPFEAGEKERYGLSATFLRLWLLRREQSKSVAGAAGTIFLNDYARSVVLRHTGPVAGRTATIPHGISDRFVAPPKAQKPLGDYGAEAPFRLLYVSIVNLYKHQWHVVEAVARLREAGVPVALDLVGPAYPPALARLRQAMRRVDPAGAFIRYHGPVAYAGLDRHYRDADAFVFASSCENMPIILLEAMAAGLPIACSNRGPMPAVLGEAGVYFDPEDPPGIEAALRALLEHPEIRAASARKASAIAATYSWTRCAAETFAFLSEVFESTHEKGINR